MNTALAIFAALGGITTFGLAVWAIVRAIARQVTATKDNASATKLNTEALDAFREELRQMDSTIGQHGERIARLEGRPHSARTTR